MEQRDYFMRQIDQLGRVLGKILVTILGLKQIGETHEVFEITTQTFKSELDWDLDEIINYNDDKLIDILKNEKGFNNGNLETLADILLVLADENKNKESEKNKNIYLKILIIYQYLEETDTIFSLERYSRIERIKKLL